MKRGITLGISIDKKKIYILDMSTKIEVIQKIKEELKKRFDTTIDSHATIYLDGSLNGTDFYDNLHDQIIGWLAYLNIIETEAETMIQDFFKTLGEP